MHQKSNQNLFTNCKSFLNECKKNTVELFENDTSDKTDEENDKYCFFQNDPDEENTTLKRVKNNRAKMTNLTLNLALMTM